MEKLEKTMDYLRGVDKELDAFDGVELTQESRKKLYATIQKLTKSEFVREDKDGRVQLFWGQETHASGMNPDITIGVHNNKISIDTWILWKTITSYYEMLQERKAYREF